jgi:hypothetical protein
MRELRAHLSFLVSVFVSVEFFLVPLPMFVLVLLVLLVFAFAVVRLVSDERLFCISGVEKFSPTSLYKRRLCT